MSKESFKKWCDGNPGCRPSPFALNPTERHLALEYAQHIKEYEDYLKAGKKA